jgi:GntR family transcriptional regulator, transcriptional repressor for pyruvate dehydrogenase complex
MNTTLKPKIRRKRLSEELTVQLRKYIIEEGLKPGDSLLTEDEMVKRFGVSHTVVREATKALDFLGIIDAAPRRGMILDKFDFERVSEYFGFHFALCDYPREKLLGSRAVIEVGSLPYTMEAMKKNPDIYKRLRDLAEAVSPEWDHVDNDFTKYDIAFHRGIVEASGLTPLVSICDLLQAFFRKFRSEVANNVQAASKSHGAIVEALHQGNLDSAIDQLRAHLSHYTIHEVPQEPMQNPKES